MSQFMAENMVKASPANLVAGVTEGGILGTRGGLVRARLVDIDNAIINNEKNTIVLSFNNTTIQGEGKINIPCMFNPYEYTLSKSNQFKEKDSPQSGNSPYVDFVKAGPQTLQLRLIFDTYEITKGAEQGVTEITNKLWKLMGVRTQQVRNEQDRKSPPLVAFIWGNFYFVAYITQMTQKFTLFSQDGIPVRAEVDITFTQYVDIDDYPNQNPTSGGGPINQTWQVTAGDRLDNIATAVYGSAAKWRLIADYNNLHEPTRLRVGQQLLIPLER